MKIRVLVVDILAGVLLLASGCTLPFEEKRSTDGGAAIVIEVANIEVPSGNAVDNEIDIYFPDRQSEDTEWVSLAGTAVYSEDEYNSAVINAKNCYIEGVKPIKQFPELPTGCEVTALEIAMNYKNYNVDRFTLCDKYLKKGNSGQSNPYVAFIGNPYNKNGYGCYAPVIAECARSAGADAVNVSYCQFGEILNYLQTGNPVIVWATISMNKSYEGSTGWKDANNKLVKFKAQEHCMVLIGVDVNKVIAYIADPYYGTVKEYNLKTFYTRWVEQDKQAVVIK